MRRSSNVNRRNDLFGNTYSPAFRQRVDLTLLTTPKKELPERPAGEPKDAYYYLGLCLRLQKWRRDTRRKPFVMPKKYQKMLDEGNVVRPKLRK